MSQIALRHLHLTCIALSGAFFLLRGFWMLADSPMLARRWVRIVPHCVDTLLLGSAIGLVVLTAQYPFEQAWLTAKLAGLLAYILCGVMALRRAPTKPQRAAWLLAAVLAFAYIVGVALTRKPLLGL